MQTHIVRNAIQCPDGTILHSKNRHDYQSHEDTTTGEYYFNDGGNEYVRRSVNKTPYIDLTITTDDPFEEQRKYFTWGSYGVNGMSPRKETLLKDLETDHIHAIIRTQTRFNGTYVEAMFLNELEFRKQNG